MPTDTLIEVQLLAPLLLQMQTATIPTVMSFLGNDMFCANTCTMLL